MSPVQTSWPVKYKCGHTEKRDLSTVPASKRPAAARSDFWATKAGGDGMVCTKCWKKNATADREQRNKQLMLDAADFEELHELPELTGTPKQVTSGLVDNARKDRFIVLADLIEAAGGEAAASEVLSEARTLTRAGWWANNLGYKVREENQYGPEEYTELIHDGAAHTAQDSERPEVTAENPFDWAGDAPDDRP